LLGSGSKPLQLFGLRKTPELSLALKQALPLLGRNGLRSSDGRLVRTARSRILADFLHTRDVRAVVTIREVGMRWPCRVAAWSDHADERHRCGREIVWAWPPGAEAKLATMLARRVDNGGNRAGPRGDHV